MSQESLLEWRSFVVDERPACMWGVDLPKQNDDFLLGLDAAHFTRSIESHLPLLETNQKHSAALAIRTVYAHALETMFALLCAAVQAPHCPLGWILRYKPGDVPRIVRKIDEGLPLLGRLTFGNRWLGLSERIHCFTHSDPSEDRRIKDLFAETWSRLAVEFLDPLESGEYNSIKHGLRAKASGMSFRMARTDDPDAKPIIDSASEFGSRFFATESLHDDRVNFYVKYAGRAWSPQGLVAKTELVSLSISNIVSFLRTKIGVDVSEVRFQWPEAQDNLRLAWQSPGTIRSFIADDKLDVAKHELRKAEQILQPYKTGPDL